MLILKLDELLLKNKAVWWDNHPVGSNKKFECDNLSLRKGTEEMVVDA